MNIDSSKLEYVGLADSRQVVLMDAAQEISGLINQTIKSHYPQHLLNDSSMHAMRGVLLRISTLAEVMFIAGCYGDEDLLNAMKRAYGSHHGFAPEVREEAREA